MIYTHNDGMALGAVSALEAAGRLDDVKVVGIDGEEAAYQAIKELVESQGGTMASVIKITTYVTDMRYRVDLAAIREEFLGKKGPASTLVEIPSLAHPDWMIEIEAIAVI